MRSFLTPSTTPTATGTSPTSQAPSTPTVSLPSADEPLPRRLKSKSSLRSLGSSNHDDDLSLSPGSDNDLVRPSILRRLSPGLAARVKLLDGSHKQVTSSRSPGLVGRIPEEHIKELDSLHQDLSLRVERRGRAWQGQQAGGLQVPFQVDRGLGLKSEYPGEQDVGSSVATESRITFNTEPDKVLSAPAEVTDSRLEQSEEHVSSSGTATESHILSNTEPEEQPEEERVEPGTATENPILSNTEPDEQPEEQGQLEEEHVEPGTATENPIPSNTEPEGQPGEQEQPGEEYVEPSTATESHIPLDIEPEEERVSPSTAEKHIPSNTKLENTSEVTEPNQEQPEEEHVSPNTKTDNHIPSTTEPSATADRTVDAPLDPGVEQSNQPRASGADDTAAVMSVEPSAPLRSDPEPETDTREQTDFEKYLQRTAENDERRGRTLQRGSRPASISSYSLHRTDSIYSFSRVSFESQISQLTSISLPQPSTLESTIAGISNAPAAVKALAGAAEQIQTWIRRASDVLSSMDANDEVEWAAAGGRGGLEDVDKAITKFESVVSVYVKGIEEVQLREDIGNVGNDNLKMTVLQMESILKRWARIRYKLKQVKEQVELAMEWEELCMDVLWEVGQEVEKLKDLVFEMEEIRHMDLVGEPESNGLDINELETIVEETPDGQTRPSKRFSMDPILDAPPTLDTPIIQTPHDDTNNSNLMALFARMQPLRASLDFLPMRLSMFQARAESLFPSACESLEDRRTQLENDYKELQKDAETLRLELSEDRWVIVFRNAGIQAKKMFESVERSIGKLQEALETGAHLNNPGVLTKRIESYEAKKAHYVPAIERVISIVQKGVNDRQTVNGVITMLLSDMQSRMDALKASVRVMDASLEDVNISHTHHLRDSISSIITMDSPATASAVDTPGSSPASSVVLPPGALKGASTPIGNSSRRGSSVGSAARTTMSKVRRLSGIPQASANPSNRKSSIPKPALASPSASKHPPVTPTPATRKVSRPQPAPLNRPRWNGSTNTSGLVVGHSFRPVSPNSNLKPSHPSRTPRSSSTIPFASPFRRDLSASPAPSATRSTSRVGSRLASRSPGVTAPSPTPARSSILDPPPYSKLRRQPAPTGMANTPRNRQSFAGAFSRSVSQAQDPGLASPKVASRPGTSLGHSGNRRISLLPLPKIRGKENAGGKSKLDQRPPWR